MKIKAGFVGFGEVNTPREFIDGRVAEAAAQLEKRGVELVKALRADARFCRIPVFAVTADAEFVRDERSAIFDGILLKPITYDRLMEVFSGERG